MIIIILIDRKRQTDSSDEEDVVNRGRGQEALEFSQAQVRLVIIMLWTTFICCEV